jgi:hypothetical protein
MTKERDLEMTATVGSTERDAPLSDRRRAVVTRRVAQRPLTAHEEITELNPVRERVAA